MIFTKILMTNFRKLTLKIVIYVLQQKRIIKVFAKSVETSEVNYQGHIILNFKFRQRGGQGLI